MSYPVHILRETAINCITCVLKTQKRGNLEFLLKSFLSKAMTISLLYVLKRLPKHPHQPLLQAQQL